MRILIVDDHEDTANVLAQICALEGYEVSVALTTEDALIIAGKTPFDLALMDFALPRMDGATLARHLLKVNERTAIIGLTAAVSKEVQETMLAAGIRTVLFKPFDYQRLRACMRACMPTELH